MTERNPVRPELDESEARIILSLVHSEEQIAETADGRATYAGIRAKIEHELEEIGHA